MLTQQRLFAKVVFESQFATLHSNAFQEYFQKLMQYRYPTFLPVVPYGKLGDQASDGLCTLGDKLYACYGPESPDDRETTRKFRSDLDGALEKRPGQFSTFVFVHNDRRGMHPRVATEIKAAAKLHPKLTFEQMGKVLIWRELMRLSLEEAEDILGQEIKVDELVYGLSLADLAPLLTHLARTRDRSSLSSPNPIPSRKLEFNALSQDIREFVIHGMRFSKQVYDYYAGHYDVLAEDEAAAAFKEKYLELRGPDKEPDEIFQDLVVYVVGNMIPSAAIWTSAYTILSYFFQKCHIFEEPPGDWKPSPGGAS